MSEKIEIIKTGKKTQVYYYGEDDRVPSKDFEILEDSIVGDWQVSETTDGGVGGMYVQSRQGGVQYALQRCGVIEDGDWERAPDRC